MVECSADVAKHLLHPVILVHVLVEIHILEYAEVRDESVLNLVTKDCELILVAYEII